MKDKEAQRAYNKAKGASGMRGDTVTVNRVLVTESCIRCGIEWAFPREFKNRRVDDHATFYCPNGHGQVYSGKTEAEQLAEKLETEQRNTEFWRKQNQNAEHNLDIARRQRDAYKGHNTRLKKRVSKGKCPCCSSTFVNLAAHMAKRHPDFGGEVRDEQGAADATNDR